MGTTKIQSSKKKRPDLLVIAGEHSGDQNIAQYIKELKEAHLELVIYAFGGKCLSEAGARLLFDMTKFSVVGLSEVIAKYFFFKKLLNRILAWIKRNKPRTVCLVDYPGLNLRIAEALFRKKLSQKSGGSIRVVYYTSPQIWAWKKRRRFLLEKYVDSLGTIFEFEKGCYNDTSLDVEFVGHPFKREEIENYVAYSTTAPVLLLPGSRIPAIRKIFPAMLKCFREFSKSEQTKMATVMYASDQALHLMRRILNKRFSDLKGKVSFIPDSRKVEACATLMSSGTMSLKCCLAGIPGAILYKSASLTYLVGKYFLKIKRLGIANILLKKKAWPEFIQGDIRPKIIA
ncbi:MAG: lipid-A-disaccharide synthase, partial [Opitutales bacterium]|nr:lipid-A-disaccharide synthase [Opitutales bacterium]